MIQPITDVHSSRSSASSNQIENLSPKKIILCVFEFEREMKRKQKTAARLCRANPNIVFDFHSFSYSYKIIIQWKPPILSSSILSAFFSFPAFLLLFILSIHVVCCCFITNTRHILLDGVWAIWILWLIKLPHVWKRKYPMIYNCRLCVLSLELYLPEIIFFNQFSFSRGWVKLGKVRKGF